MRLAPPLLRFSCGVGLSVLVFSLFPGGGALADGVPAASPDDMVLDLGGATLETRRIAHGSFTQGAPASEVGHDKEEEPAHHVTITKDFWMGKYPVTRGQFAKFVADTRYVSDAEKGQSGGAGWVGAMVPDGGKGPVLVQKKDFTWRNPGFTQTDEHPVVLVSYGDANAFVGWASRKSGKRVRLPTESEWEFAARGGGTTSWSGGAAAESDPASYGWFKPNAGNGTRPVGQKKANPFGLFDMSGNVMEWCRDVYAPYREGALIDPEVTTNTSNEPERRVLRGGSWFRDPKRGRSAARYKNTPGSRNADNGFRVVVTNEEAVTPGLTGPGPDFVPSGPLGASGSTSGAPGGSSGNGGSGPLADGEPLRLEPVGHPGDAFSWGLLLASPVAAASAVVAWMLLRRKKKKPTTRASAVAAKASGISTEALSNGFVVRISDAAPGASVRFECVVKGKRVSDVVLLDASKETFVRTGSPPTAIRILESIAAAPAVYRPSAPGAAPVSSPAPPSASGGQRSSGVPPRAPPPLPSRPRTLRPPVPSPPLDSVIIERASPAPAGVESSVDAPMVPTGGSEEAIAAAPVAPPIAPVAPPIEPEEPDETAESLERTEPLPPVAPRASAPPPPPIEPIEPIEPEDVRETAESMQQTEPLHPLAPRAPVEDATVAAPKEVPVAESASVAPADESAPAPAAPIEASLVIMIGPAAASEGASPAPAAPIEPAAPEATAAASTAPSEPEAVVMVAVVAVAVVVVVSEPVAASEAEAPVGPSEAAAPVAPSEEAAPSDADKEAEAKSTDADAPPRSEPPHTS